MFRAERRRRTQRCVSAQRWPYRLDRSLAAGRGIGRAPLTRAMRCPAPATGASGHRWHGSCRVAAHRYGSERDAAQRSDHRRCHPAGPAREHQEVGPARDERAGRRDLRPRGPRHLPTRGAPARKARLDRGRQRDRDPARQAHRLHPGSSECSPAWSGRSSSSRSTGRRWTSPSCWWRRRRRAPTISRPWPASPAVCDARFPHRRQAARHAGRGRSLRRPHPAAGVQRRLRRGADASSRGGASTSARSAAPTSSDNRRGAGFQRLLLALVRRPSGQPHRVERGAQASVRVREALRIDRDGARASTGAGQRAAMAQLQRVGGPHGAKIGEQPAELAVAHHQGLGIGDRQREAGPLQEAAEIAQGPRRAPPAGLAPPRTSDSAADSAARNSVRVLPPRRQHSSSPSGFSDRRACTSAPGRSLTDWSDRQDTTRSKLPAAKGWRSSSPTSAVKRPAPGASGTGRQPDDLGVGQRRRQRRRDIRARTAEVEHAAEIGV